MRSADITQDKLFSYRTLEQRIPKDSWWSTSNSICCIAGLWLALDDKVWHHFSFSYCPINSSKRH